MQENNGMDHFHMLNPKKGGRRKCGRRNVLMVLYFSICLYVTIFFMKCVRVTNISEYNKFFLRDKDYIFPTFYVALPISVISLDLCRYFARAFTSIFSNFQTYDNRNFVPYQICTSFFYHVVY